MNEYEQRYKRLVDKGHKEWAEEFKFRWCKDGCWYGTKGYKKLEDIEYLIRVLEDYKMFIKKPKTAAVKDIIQTLNEIIKEVRLRVENDAY